MKSTYLIILAALLLLFSCSKKRPISPSAPDIESTPSAVITAMTDTATTVPPATYTYTATATQIFTQTSTGTNTSTYTGTALPISTHSSTLTATVTLTRTAPATLTSTLTPTLTLTHTAVQTSALTFTPSASLTVSMTLTAVISMTATVTGSPIISPTFSMTITPSVTRTDTRTATISPTASITRTVTPTATMTSTTGVYVYFGGTYANYAYSVTQTADGGYAMFGTRISSMWMVKTDNTGALEWEKTYYDGKSWGNCGKKTPDGGYIILGTRNNSVPGSQNILLVKVDAAGDCVWSREYGSDSGGIAAVDQGFSVDNTSDGGYVIAGETECMGAGGFDEYIIKVDANGDCVWSMTYGTASNEKIFSVEQAPDGGYIAAGGTNGATVRKLYTDGSQQWLFKTGAGTSTYFKSARATADGGVIAVGALDGGTDQAGLIQKVNSSGAGSWWKTLGDASHGDTLYYGEQTADNGYIITGWTSSYVFESLVVEKTDASGNQIWMKLFDTGDLNNEVGMAIHSVPDGGYIACGYNSLYGEGKAILMKLDSTGGHTW